MQSRYPTGGEQVSINLFSESDVTPELVALRRRYAPSSPLVPRPSRLHTGPSRLHTGPSRLHTGPSRLHTGPSRLHTGPSRLHTGPRSRGYPRSCSRAPAWGRGALESGPPLHTSAPPLFPAARLPFPLSPARPSPPAPRPLPAPSRTVALSPSAASLSRNGGPVTRRRPGRPVPARRAQGGSGSSCKGTDWGGLVKLD